ncbi:MAG: hypothetical protein N2595_02440 [bacterium]|nr:hypothetical protein [bacterium]
MERTKLANDRTAARAKLIHKVTETLIFPHSLVKDLMKSEIGVAGGARLCEQSSQRSTEMASRTSAANDSLGWMKELIHMTCQHSRKYVVFVAKVGVGRADRDTRCLGNARHGRVSVTGAIETVSRSGDQASHFVARARLAWLARLTST